MLTHVPLGGLGNRMRSTAAAIALAERMGMRLRVVWCRDAGLNSRFDALFQPLPSAAEVVEANALQAFCHGVARKRNLYLPGLWQRLRYDLRIGEAKAAQLRQDAQAMETLMRPARRALTVTGVEFYPVSDELLRTLFVPAPALMQRIDELSAKLGSAVGMHIRRTDNSVSAQESPLTLFLAKADEWARRNPATHFYVATDSEDVKRAFQQRFPGKVLTAPQQARRDTADGVADAVVEMYALARTVYFYGSYYSSFSDIVLSLRQASNGEIIRMSR